MIKLQYWNREEWVDAGEFITENLCWVSLGGDDENYRTVDEDGKVLTDKSTEQAKFEQQAKFEKDKPFEEITHAIIAIGKDDMDRMKSIPPDKLSTDDFYFNILHFCGYWSEPNINEYLSLYNELNNDSEFKIYEDFYLVPAPKGLIKQTIKDIS